MSILTLIACSVFFAVTLQHVQGADELVTVSSTSYGGVTVVEYINNEENIFDIKSVVLEIEKGGNFKSFKTENGWIGKKTSSDEITFTSTLPIKPGQSAKFGIKTDASEPVFGWKAFDEEGDEVGSGRKMITINQTQIPPDEDSKENTKKSTGVLENSSFKIIPSTPKAGSSLRIVGEGFGAGEKLDFYIDNNRIDSFVTDKNGSFILTTKIPDTQRAERSDFIIKDQTGNQKTKSLTIKESSPRIVTNDISLTLDPGLEPVWHRGDEKTISGTASAGSTLTISLSDSSGKVLTTFTDKVDNTGKYSINHRVPVDRPYGQYSISITDGKKTVTYTYVVETTQKIVLSSLKQKYDPGETVIINGTAIANQEIQIVIKDPVDMEAYSKNLIVGDDGIVTLEYALDTAAKEGTYVISVTQGDEHETFLFGVGELPEVQMIVTMSKTNYKTSDKAIIFITGLPSSTANLIVIDPSDKSKFSDTITIGADGYSEYSFELEGYSPGVYTTVLSRGNAQVEKRFSVGLQTSPGPIEIRSAQDTYTPGESILLIGNAKPNVIITITLKDPNGIGISTEEVFTNKDGVFTSSSFRIPTGAQQGVWVLDASSGLNHVTEEIIVLPESSDGITVSVDKNPPTYHVEEVLTISGTGAGKSHTVVIEIFDSAQTKIQEFRIIATGAGTYSTIWQIPKDSVTGTYSIEVSDGKNTSDTTFTIQ